MCDTCRPALGLLCMTHRVGGEARGREREGESIDGNGGRGSYFVLHVREGNKSRGKCRKRMKTEEERKHRSWVEFGAQKETNEEEWTHE